MINKKQKGKSGSRNYLVDLLEKVPFPIVSASSLDDDEYYMNHYAKTIVKNEGLTEDFFVSWIKNEFRDIHRKIGVGGRDSSSRGSILKNPFSRWSLELLRTAKQQYIFFPSVMIPPDAIGLLERKIVEMEKTSDFICRVGQGDIGNFLYKDIVTQDASFRKVICETALYADKKIPLLITGEIGTGNVSLGKLVHDLSPSAEKPFVFVNCEQLIVNDVYHSFFGKKKTKEQFGGKAGLFLKAEGGTIYLKEIQALPIHIQEIIVCTMLGWAYDDGVNLLRHPDVRIIVDSSLGMDELEKLVENSSFLEELFDLLANYHIRNIPLRERREDIPLLTDFFMNKKLGNNHGIILDSATRQKLYEYGYPENIRELKIIVGSIIDLHLTKGLRISTALDNIFAK